jgi:hypothetical protein
MAMTQTASMQLREATVDRTAADRRTGTGVPTRPAGQRAQAVGAMAIGALALGAFAVGALAIGRLAIGRMSVRRLRIDELEVGRLRVRELVGPDAGWPTKSRS